jgi:tetratricopeptide (TPR) repeat protein
MLKRVSSAVKMHAQHGLKYFSRGVALKQKGFGKVQLRSLMTRTLQECRNGEQRYALGIRPSCWLLLLVTLLISACASPQQKAEHHLEEAAHWAARGKTNEAILEYRRTIQLDPKNTTARLALARIFIAQQDYASAYQQLNKVLQNTPDNEEAQGVMADLMLKSRKFPEAQQWASGLISKNQDNIAALMILAQSAFAMKDLSLAKTTTDHVLELDPKNSTAWYLRAILQLGSKQNSNSEASLLRAIEYNPDSAAPVEALAGLLAQRGDLPAAEAMVRKVLTKSPENIQVHYLLAAVLIAQNRPKEVEEVFRRTVVMGEKDPGHRGMLARYYVISGDISAAQSEYQKILKKHPDDVQNGLQLAAVLLEQGHTSDAKRMVDDFVKRNPNDPRTLLFRGRFEVDGGQLEEGIRDIQHAAQLQPQWALPPYFLGLAYIRDGKLDLAEGALNQAAQLDANFLTPSVLLAQMALNQGKPERAIAAVKTAVKQKSPMLQPYLLHTMALLQEGRYDEAEKETRPLIDEFPEPAEQAMIFRTLAWAKFHQKLYDDARKFAKESLNYDPTSQETLLLLGDSLIALNEPQKALSEVESYVRSNPQSASAYEALGQIQAAAGRSRDAENSFQKALELDSTLVSSQLLLSDIEKQEGKLDEAMNVLLKLAASQPRSVEVHLRMGQISELKGDWAAAQSHYSRVLELESANPIAKNNLAAVYAEHGGNIDLALRLAQEAKEYLPDNTEVSDTLAWILVKKQSYGTAIQLLRECVQKDPVNASFRYHLGVAYYRAGQKSEAEQSLRAALKVQPTFSNAQDAIEILHSLSN